MPEDVRVMRRAGESLSSELVRLNDKFDLDALTFLGLPLVAASLPFWLVQSVAAPKHLGLLIAGVALGVAALIYGTAKMLRTIMRIRNARLALYGERVVGDRLMELATDGYEVFHDVPCVGGGGHFNLDHVVVGRGSVVVVETKTYRKPGDVEDDHKVSYDDHRLNWPGWSSTKELNQTLAGAKWLREELRNKLSLDVPVHAALTIPGWYVKGGSPKAPVLVENAKRLPKFIRDRFPCTLGTKEVDLVRKHLRSMCETVDFQSMNDGL